MTKVNVNCGNCGYSAAITATKGEGKKVRVSVDSECEMVTGMLEDVSIMDMRTLFTGHFANPVYRSAEKHLKHVACPVPVAILKAAEVELGLCVPKDVHITFEKKKGK